MKESILLKAESLIPGDVIEWYASGVLSTRTLIEVKPHPNHPKRFFIVFMESPTIYYTWPNDSFMRVIAWLGERSDQTEVIGLE